MAILIITWKRKNILKMNYHNIFHIGKNIVVG